ncbi:hypothetical protein CMUS01_13497 [Colletotrichum musicola]|uniref:Uncharacterized protein n=1 Tax=Colletotrichum musicola TaxID=2175873 RepID=A0A8H6MW39_9PEZI|nr:hypothetical protein CMUS01_13497 [Colletotrichum musicola]
MEVLQGGKDEQLTGNASGTLGLGYAQHQFGRGFVWAWNLDKLELFSGSVTEPYEETESRSINDAVNETSQAGFRIWEHSAQPYDVDKAAAAAAARHGDASGRLPVLPSWSLITSETYVE